MGAIQFRGAEFVGSFGELTGYKSGLAITEERLQQILAEGGFGDAWPAEADTPARPIRP